MSTIKLCENVRYETAIALDTNTTAQTIDVQKVRDALKADGVLLRK